jgi:hypothetical protein
MTVRGIENRKPDGHPIRLRRDDNGHRYGGSLDRDVFFQHDFGAINLVVKRARPELSPIHWANAALRLVSALRDGAVGGKPNGAEAPLSGPVPNHTCPGPFSANDQGGSAD